MEPKPKPKPKPQPQPKPQIAICMGCHALAPIGQPHKCGK